MPLGLIALHYESTAPVSRPQLPREGGATAGRAAATLLPKQGKPSQAEPQNYLGLCMKKMVAKLHPSAARWGPFCLTCDGR
jgi:hypothetical protein